MGVLECSPVGQPLGSERAADRCCMITARGRERAQRLSSVIFSATEGLWLKSAYPWRTLKRSFSVRTISLLTTDPFSMRPNVAAEHPAKPALFCRAG